mgnify:CR=1 FL=1
MFELKAEWGRIREGLAEVVKVLEKHEDLEEQAARLKEPLEKVKEAVKRCPIPPKTTDKARDGKVSKSKKTRR